MRSQKTISSIHLLVGVAREELGDKPNDEASPESRGHREEHVPGGSNINTHSYDRFYLCDRTTIKARRTEDDKLDGMAASSQKQAKSEER